MKAERCGCGHRRREHIIDVIGPGACQAAGCHCDDYAGAFNGR